MTPVSTDPPAAPTAAAPAARWMIFLRLSATAVSGRRVLEDRLSTAASPKSAEHTLKTPPGG
jgi:hypothetical protein